MKRVITSLLIIQCLLITGIVNGQQKNDLRYEIMLSSNMLEPSLKKDHFLNAIDISPDKYLTISTGNKFYMLGWGGINQFGKEADSTISGYAFSSDGLLMAVEKSELCYMNDKGTLITLVKLPDANMGIAAGKDVMYLFDQAGKDKQFRLYAFARGGKYKQLLISPRPINSAVEMNDSLCLAIGSGVFSFSPENNSLNLVAGLQTDSEIRSMTVDPKNNILYFATSDAIYAIQNKSLVYVTGDFGGGIIKYFGDGLVIFNPDTMDIVRIVNIEKSIVF